MNCQHEHVADDKAERTVIAIRLVKLAMAALIDACVMLEDAVSDVCSTQLCPSCMARLEDLVALPVKAAVYNAVGEVHKP